MTLFVCLMHDLFEHCIIIIKLYVDHVVVVCLCPLSVVFMILRHWNK